jgi:sugar/nucleoside kinase (ribokinase family)
MENSIPLSRQALNSHQVFVVGDLAVDFVISAEKFTGNVSLTRPEPVVGGCAYNAAIGLRGEGGLKPVVCASVGQDSLGAFILDTLRREEIIFAGSVRSAMTGFVTIVYIGENDRLMINDGAGSANDYSIDTIERAITSTHIGRGDYILFPCYALPRLGVQHCAQIMELLSSTDATLVVDLAPHNLFNVKDPVTHRKISAADIKELFKHVRILIGEYTTFLGFLDETLSIGSEARAEPSGQDLNRICSVFPGLYFDIRYGFGNISEQLICRRNGSGYSAEILETNKTGYEALPKEKRRGFGDVLTAGLLHKHLMNSFGLT